MPKKVLDIGNCAADHAAISALIKEHFDAQVVRAHGWPDASRELQGGAVDLVLVNRRLDRDHSDGLEIIRQIKSDPDLAGTPCILITNYSEYQTKAQEAGAEPGFGKSELRDPRTIEKLKPFLA